MGSQKQNGNDNLWRSWATDNTSFFGVLVVAVVVLLVAGFLFYLNYGALALYATAKYQVETEATLIQIDELDKEQTVHDDYYENDTPSEWEQHQKTEQYTLYVLHWEYELDGVKQVCKETEKYGTSHRVGDTKTLLLYSNDGVEYQPAGHSTLTNLLMVVSAAVFLVVLYAIVRLILARIGLSKKKKRKRR